MEEGEVKLENQDLAQVDYTKPEEAKEVQRKLIGLIYGKYPVDVPGIGKILVKKPTYQEHADVEAFKACETIRVAREYPAVMTERKLKKLFKESGLWTDEDENSLDSLNIKCEMEEETLADMISPTKNPDLVEVKRQDMVVTKLRKERNELLQEKQKLFANSLESIVTSVAHMFMTWRCTFGEDNKLKFKDLNEMLTLSQEKLSALNLEVWKVLLGLRNDFLDSKQEVAPGV